MQVSRIISLWLELLFCFFFSAEATKYGNDVSEYCYGDQQRL